MGMSASQARLLGITSRLTDNELQSQLLTQAKLRLATKSKAISDDYMNALSKTSLKMAAYDSTGAQTLINPTANYLYTFDELKNQYALVDANGTFLASKSMIETYESSATLADFLYKNGVTSIYENNIVEGIENTIFAEDGPLYELFTFDSDGNMTGVKSDELTLDLVDNTIEQIVTLAQNAVGGRNITNETIYNYVEALKEIRTLGYEPRKSTDFTDGIPELTLYTSNVGNVEKELTRYVTLENILGKIVWGTQSEMGLAGTNPNDNTKHANKITSPSGIVVTRENDGYGELFSMNDNGVNPPLYSAERYTQQNEVNTINFLNTYSDSSNARNYDSQIEAMKNDIIEFYCQLVKYLKDHANDADTNGTNYYNYNTGNLTVALNGASLSLRGDPVVENGTSYLDFDYYYNTYISNNEEFMELLNSFDTRRESDEQSMINWYNHVMEVKGKLSESKKDPRQQWFENLWYRMGGISETAKGEPKYKKLDSQYLNNSEWLEYSLTHGIVSLEQAKKTTKPSDLYPGLLTTDWISVQYNAIQDICEVTDDTELARAEAKYTKEMNELQAKDKDFDIKIKNLETIHQTLQTEYDSIKQIISKNVERSYKTFGNG